MHRADLKEAGTPKSLSLLFSYTHPLPSSLSCITGGIIPNPVAHRSLDAPLSFFFLLLSENGCIYVYAHS